MREQRERVSFLPHMHQNCTRSGIPDAEKATPQGGLPDRDGGSPRRGKSRTFVNLTLIAGARLAARGASRLAYHLEGAAPPACFDPLVGSSKRYRNPIAVAQEWQRLLSVGECASRADLARKLGVTRARVTQVLGLLELTPEVVEALAALGDPLPKPVVTEHGLRSILKLPAKEQKHVLRGIVESPGTG
jgi:hypothetical protein